MTKRTAEGIGKRSRGWEQRSIASEERLWADAKARWVALGPVRQLDLARCLARCRQADFARAIKQVVSVTAGLRRRKDDHGLEHLHNEPCVVFVVKRKMTEDQLKHHPTQRLPRDILTPAWIDGIEQPVAVPVDVQTQRRILSARAQGLTGIQSQGSDGRWARGALTWTIKVSGKNFAVAPVHVLSPLPDLDGVGRRSGAQAKLQGPSNSTVGEALVQSNGFGGRVIAGGALSFDVQLADIKQTSTLSSLFGGLQLSSSRTYVETEADLDALLAQGLSLEIFTPTNNRKRPAGSVPPLQAARSLVEHELPLAYDFADGSRRSTTHSVLELQIRFGERTYPGDSGSPVLLRDENDQFSFVGMHIAGDGSSQVSYVIPAWRLVAPRSYTDVDGSIPPGSISLLRRP